MQPLLSIKNLSVDFLSSSGITNAVKQISFDIKRNEVVALVGESGSGKSVTSLSILQLIPSPPAQYSSGEILFFDTDEQQYDLLKCSKTDLQDIRGNKIAMIFQEPMTSLNPVFTCGTQVMEALQRHKIISKKDARKQTIQWFEK
jgi:peptide/nickel transport system ATP-binding protein